MSSAAVLRAKPSLVPTLVYWPLMVVAFACPIGILIWLVQRTQIVVVMFVAIFVFMLVVGVVRIALELVSREFTSYTLTNSHLIVQRGIFTRRDTTVPLNRVQSAHVRRALFGQLLHYGNLVVPTAGSSVVLRWLPDPEVWQQEIMKRLAAQ